MPSGLQKNRKFVGRNPIASCKPYSVAKRKTEIVRAVCRNCGTPTVGRWCHNCGQDLFAGRMHQLRELAGDTLGNLFALDGKLLRTLWYLVAFPGRLTAEFYAGRIVRYVYPSKLFWFITIVFFALLWGVAGPRQSVTEGADEARGATVEVSENGPERRGPSMDMDFRVNPSPAETERAAETGTKTGTNAETEATADTLGAAVAETETESSLVATLNAAAANIEADAAESKFFGRLQSTAPYLVLVLVPIFALLVWWLFRRRERTYGDYLVFALHFSAFLYLQCAVWIALGAAFSGIGHAQWFFVAIPPLYLCVALRRVYRPRVVPMILKVALLGLLYLLIMCALLLSSILVIALLMSATR